MTISRLESLARRLVMVLGLGLGGAACGVGGPLPEPPPSTNPVTVGGEPAPAETPTQKPLPARRTRAELLAEAEAGLARLRALEVVEVGTLVLKLPAAAFQCYGLCWDSPTYGDAIAAEHERQLPRLAKLAELGESVLANSYPTVDKVEDASPAIAWMEALEIVDLGHLLTVAPATNPSCYNLPCQSDLDEARATNESRSWFVQRWSQMSSGL